MRVALGGKAHAAMCLDIGLGVVERGALGKHPRRCRLDRIVAAWGVSGAYQARADAVVRLFGKRELWCLGTTQAGHPRHPLYVAGDQKLVRFKPKV